MDVQFKSLLLLHFLTVNFPLTSPSNKKSHTPPRLDINTLDFSNREHVAILEEMGILLSSLPGGKVQISHLMQKAKTPEDAEEGWHLMQDIMRLMNQQQHPGTAVVWREGGRERCVWGGGVGEREREYL